MPTEIERLASVETRLASVEEVVLRMDAKLDAWKAEFVPEKQIHEMFKARDEKIADLRKDFDEYKKSQQEANTTHKMTTPQWVLVGISSMASLAALASAVVVIVHG